MTDHRDKHLEVLRRAARLPATASAKAIAFCSGLRLCPRRRKGATVRAGAVYYDARAPKAEQERMIREALKRARN